MTFFRRFLSSLRQPSLFTGSCFLVFLLALGGLSPAMAAPAWWTTEAVFQGTPEDAAAATQGQAMHMAKKARDKLAASLQNHGGVGPEIEGLFTAYNAANNTTALRLGQLKAVAVPFWKKLKSLEFPSTARLSAEHPFPWTPNLSDDEDSALANLGQVKMAFSFDLPAQTPQTISYRSGELVSLWSENLTVSGGFVISGYLFGDQDLLYGASRSVFLKSGAFVTFSNKYVASGTLAATSIPSSESNYPHKLRYGSTRYVSLQPETEVAFSGALVQKGTLAATSIPVTDSVYPHKLHHGTNYFVWLQPGTEVIFSGALVQKGILAIISTIVSEENYLVYLHRLRHGTNYFVSLQPGTEVVFSGALVQKGTLATTSISVTDPIYPHRLHHGTNYFVSLQQGTGVAFSGALVQLGTLATTSVPVADPLYPHKVRYNALADPVRLREGTEVLFSGAFLKEGILAPGMSHSLRYQTSETADFQGGSKVLFSESRVRRGVLAVGPPQQLDYGYNRSAPFLGGSTITIAGAYVQSGTLAQSYSLGYRYTYSPTTLHGVVIKAGSPVTFSDGLVARGILAADNMLPYSQNNNVSLLGGTEVWFAGSSPHRYVVLGTLKDSLTAPGPGGQQITVQGGKTITLNQTGVTSILLCVIFSDFGI